MISVLSSWFKWWLSTWLLLVCTAHWWWCSHKKGNENVARKQQNTHIRLPCVWLKQTLSLVYFRANKPKALAGEHAGDLKHEEERRKKRGLNKPCTFPLQGSLWFVFGALRNHGMDDSSGNQSSLESMDIPSKQRLQIALLTEKVL